MTADDIGVTYPEVGATRLGPLPPGYRHLTYRTRVGRGGLVMDAAARALLGWRMHEEAGVRVDATPRWAAPGLVVVSHIGLGRLRLRAPCRVVWTETSQRRVGFGYGTLPGHPVRGEEAFVLTYTPDDTVWFEVRAFSRPSRWHMRLAGPLGPVLQREYARRCGAALRRLSPMASPSAKSL